MKIITIYFIDKIIEEEKTEKFLNQFKTIEISDMIYIYDSTSNIVLKEKLLTGFKNIEYHTYIPNGEVNDIANVIDSIKDIYIGTNTYFCFLKTGYYFEQFGLSLLKKCLESTNEKISVLTPVPLFSTEYYDKEDQENKEMKCREIKGCKLIGTLINLDIYNELSGFEKEYYETTYDYDYCIKTRLNGYKVYLNNDVVLRNENYNIISKKILNKDITSYEYLVNDIYYETRNRMYLWDKYKNTDKDYIKLDKKLYKLMVKSIKKLDPNVEYKMAVIKQAKSDYKNNIKNKWKREK